MDERKWHKIRPNEQTRIPRRHVFIDSEAYREWSNGVEQQYWRCGVAIYATRGRANQYDKHGCDYSEPKTMWRDVSDFANSEGRTIVWCHNLGYDVRVTDMLEILPTLGWTLACHNLSPRGTWLEWRRGHSTIVCTDSFSVFPTSIERIGQWLGIGKPDLPDESATMATWLDRCRSDTRILCEAILGYLEWIKREDMGNWQLTGNGQAWAAFRHKFMTHALTVHDDAEALEAERRAMWAGRCEAYWHGKIRGTRVYEYDYVRSYPTIARDHRIPVKLVGTLDDAAACWRVAEMETHALLAEVEIETKMPVVPAEYEGRILWPVGVFRTTLWDVEILAAIEAGAHVTILKGWAYRTEYALQAWGEWILGELDKDDSVVPAWLKSIYKHWSRALIGRMAMTYQAWELDGEMPFSTVQAGWMKDETTGEIGEYLQVGTSMFVQKGRTEWQHSMPMITGYVQAIARVQLWGIISKMPRNSVLYTDTDSVFITEYDREELERIIGETPGCTLRVKNVYQGMEIYGPRQIVTGEEVRFAGVPKRAERVERELFKGEVWESIGTAMASGRFNTVQVRDRTWRISGIDYRRRATEHGFTEPIELGA